jgi:hypothetical protein
MSRHVHQPLPRETYVREGMSYAERIVAETKDALLHGRKVECICGREGFIRNHGKGIRWFRPDRKGKP